MEKEIETVFTNGNIWAIIGESDSGNSELLQKLDNKAAERVSFKHNFRTLSNTTDFYYQQRFNSFDSEDSLTVQQHLDALTGKPGYWSVKSVTEKLRLAPLLDEQLIKLSNGETKRVLIASALIKNPGTLLLDHPLTGLDVKTRETFSELLEEIASAGVKIIMTTGPWDIPAAITHVAVMKEGKIIYSSAKKDFNIKDFDFAHEVKVDTNKLKELLRHDHSEQFNIMIGMKNVTIKYDDKKILDNINWEVKQGERWSLSGPNGAGKSTLLSLVNGDNPQAYANDIVLFDRKRGSGESIWDIKRKIGFVSPELYQYFPTDSSCLHVIESGFYDTIGLFRPTDPAKEKICLQWMELLQVKQYTNKLFSLVPSSVQRLCLLARALVKNPPLLVLDEPTQGLDSYQQQFFTKLIGQICELSDVTLVYVSHYRQHIPENVTRSIQLEKGVASIS